MTEAKFCPRCGAPRKPGSSFCGKCGHAFVATAAPTQTAAPVAQTAPIPAATMPPPAPTPAAAPLPTATYVTPAPAPAAVGPPSPDAFVIGGTRIPLPIGVGRFAAIGGVLALAGSFLPWYTFVGQSISSWDVPVTYLLSGAASSSGLKVGLLLLAAGVLALPFATKKPLPHWVLAAVAMISINSGLVSIVRATSEDTGVGFGFGLFATVIGGALIGYEWFTGRKAVAPPRSA